jgi:chemotaxis protein MotB
MARRKQRHEEHPDERWLITYADVLTLMFVLFMVLFSISVVNTAKFDLLKQTLQDAFNSGLAQGGESVLETNPGTPAPAVTTQLGQIAPDVPTLQGLSVRDASPEQVLESGQLEAARESIESKLEQAGVSGRVSTSLNERGLAIRLETDGVLFAPGSAALQPGGARIIAPIAASLKRLPNPVRVDGHTDSSPIATAAFPSNWELSGARASAVVRTMIGAGIPSGRLQASGFADTEPIGDNDSAAGRAMNRRVEILVLRMQGAPSQSPATALGG